MAEQQAAPVAPDRNRQPKVGDSVYYRLRPYGEWVKAKVIEHILDRNGHIQTELEPPLEDGQVHLEIVLDRKRHNAAATRGFRLNVSRGTASGEWDFEPPAGWRVAFEQEQERQAIIDEENRKRARAGAL